MRSPTDPDLRDDARVFYKDISSKLRVVKAKLAKGSRRGAMSGLDIEAESDATLALLDDLPTRLDDAPAGALREVFTALGVTLTVRFEKKRISQRQINQVHAAVRLGANGPLALPTLLDAPGGTAALALEIDGRGDRRRAIPNAQQVLVEQALTHRPFRAVWSKVMEMSGWRPLPHKPKARFNGTTFQVRRRGYKTLAQICEASGVPNTTLRRWLGKQVPELPLIDGIRAIADEEFDSYVETCRSEYLAAKKTRNKAKAAARGGQTSCGQETA